MKLEQLAALLKKDATEFSSTLNLDAQAEVPDDILTRELTSFHSELKVNYIAEGKKQGDGMAKRLVMTEAEKALKDAFGIDGKDFNELVDNLKVLKSSEGGKVDEKIKADAEKWKQTALAKETEIQTLKSQFETIQTTEKIRGQILPKLDKFEFATAKVREVAINEFLSTKKFKVDGSDIFLERHDNTFVVLSDNEIESHFKEFGTIKQGKPPGTPPRQPSGTSYGSSKAEIYKAIDKATTAEEITALREQLNALED